MSEMVERVAWEMAQMTGTGFHDLAERDKAKWVPLARIAIAAMRRPSQSVLAAGIDWISYYDGDPEAEMKAINFWEVMIDAALADV